MMNLGEGESQTVVFSPAFPYHGAFFFRTNQHGSCGKPVRCPRENGSALVPNDLLVVQEADAEEAIEHFASEYRGVPHVADLQAGHERERVAPIGARIAADRGFGVAGGAASSCNWAPPRRSRSSPARSRHSESSCIP